MENLYITSEGGTRLRNLRSRKRIARTDHEKYLRACNKRQDVLLKQRRELPLVPLDEPYQRGYVRFFVVCEDVKRSKSGEFFEDLLRKINTYQYADNRKFQKKKKRRGKRTYIPLKQELRSFSQWEWEERCRKGRFTPREQALFGKVECYCHRSKRFETYYEFIDQWRFELRVRPYMITHYRPIDVAIERELADLEKVTEDYKNRGIIRHKIYGGSYSWKQYEKRYTPKEKYKRTPLKEVVALRYHTSAIEIADFLLEVNI